MALTTAQLATLKSDIAANTNTVLINGQATQIKDVPVSPDNGRAVADWYNLTASPAFIVWRDLDMATVLGLITYGNMTPIDPVPTDTALNVAIWQGRSLVCQGKQFNLQNLTIGRATAPMKKTSYRAAMQDCLTNLPAGASGALVSAGWIGVRDGSKFSASNIEKLFATGTGSTASPADLVHDGNINGTDVMNAWAS